MEARRMSPRPRRSSSICVSSGEAIKVAVRVRPFSKREQQNGCRRVVDMTDEFSTVVTDPTVYMNNNEDDIEAWQTRFTFDRCFWSFSEDGENKFASQQDIFDIYGPWIIENAVGGYNCSLFAYGQTGSGKSHTMMGSDALSDLSDAKGQAGFIPRLCHRLFSMLGEDKPGQSQLHVESSYFEIYNERVFDLLNTSTKTDGTPVSLRVREHPKTGAYVEDLFSIAVNCYSEIEALLTQGATARRVAETRMNKESSRSHAIFQLLLRSTKDVDGKKVEKISKLYLVDLAGSERVRSSGATGMRLKEAANINKSLSALSDVIKALTKPNTVDSEDGSRFVPYRNSSLTWLLKESLGGNAKTVMLATISPDAANYQETLSTLKYAERAKKIVNKARVNKESKTALVESLQSEIATLREQLAKYENSKKKDESSAGEGAHILRRLQSQQKLVANLSASWEEKRELAAQHFAKERMALDQEKMEMEKEVERLKAEKAEEERRRAERQERQKAQIEQQLKKRKADYSKQLDLQRRHDDLKKALEKSETRIADLDLALNQSKAELLSSESKRQDAEQMLKSFEAEKSQRIVELEAALFERNHESSKQAERLEDELARVRQELSDSVMKNTTLSDSLKVLEGRNVEMEQALTKERQRLEQERIKQQRMYQKEKNSFAQQTNHGFLQIYNLVRTQSNIVDHHESVVEEEEKGRSEDLDRKCPLVYVDKISKLLTDTLDNERTQTKRYREQLTDQESVVSLLKESEAKLSEDVKLRERKAEEVQSLLDEKLEKLNSNEARLEETLLENCALQKQLTAKNEEMLRLKEKLELDLEAMRQEGQASEQALLQSSEVVKSKLKKELESERAQWKEKVEALEQEWTDKESGLLQACETLKAGQVELEGEIQILKTNEMDLTKFKCQLEKELENEKSRGVELQSSYENLKSEKAGLEDDLKGLKNTEVELLRVNTDLELEKAQLQEKVETLGVEWTAKETELLKSYEGLKTKLERALEAAAEKYELEKKQWQQECEALAQMKAEEASQLTGNISELGSANTQLKQRIEKLTADHVEAEQRMQEENAVLTAQVVETNEKLSKVSVQLQAAKSELEASAQSIGKLELEKLQEHKELAAVKTKLEEEKLELFCQIESIGAECEEYLEQKNVLTEKVEALSKELEIANIKLSNTSSQLETDKERHLTKYRDLEVQLEEEKNLKHEQEKRVNELVEKLLAFEKEKGELQSKWTCEMRDKDDMIQMKQREYQLVTEKKQELSTVYKETCAKLKEKETEIAALLEEKQSFEVLSLSKDEKIETLEETIYQKNAKIDELTIVQLKLAQLKEEFSKQSTVLEEQTLSCEKLRKAELDIVNVKAKLELDLLSAQEELKTQQDKEGKLMAKLEASKEEIHMLKAENGLLNQEKDHVQSQLQESRWKLECLNQQVENERKAFDQIVKAQSEVITYTQFPRARSSTVGSSPRSPRSPAFPDRSVSAEVPRPKTADPKFRQERRNFPSPFPDF